MSDLRRGKISTEDMAFIEQNADFLTPEKIAERLNRSVEVIKKHLAALPQRQANKSLDDFVVQLHANDIWPEVKKALLPAEIGYFEQQWAAYMKQFGSNSDVLATDIMMIKDLIMLDISSNRALVTKANAMRNIEDLQNRIDKEARIPFEQRNNVDLANWRTEVEALKAGLNTLSKEHLEYQQRKDAKLRDLKATRDQRFKQIEEAKRNIFELIRELDEVNNRIREGRLMEKVRLAAEKVRNDWNDVATYEDGSTDKPLLTPEGEIQDDRLPNEQEPTSRQA